MTTSMEKIYYTYAYLRLDGTPYYVGRGKKRRAYDRKKHGVKVPSRDRILILKKGLTFEESITHEKYLIYVLGRKNNNTGILRNLTDGGEGNVGWVPTDETRSRMRISQTGRVLDSQTKSAIKSGLLLAWSEGRHHDMTGENNPNADGHHGEKNGRAKLTDDDRRQIALEYTPGKKEGHNGNCSELASRYGIGMSQIRRIARNPRWTS